jgi:hypothetical protein
MGSLAARKTLKKTTQIEQEKKKTTTKDSNPKALIPCYSLYERFRHKR